MQPEVDYTVILVLPGFGAEREHAETIVEAALEWLNTYKEEPGFRFAPPVSAHLEIVGDADEARTRIDTDESLAMVILHDVADEERDTLVRECNARHIGACYTVDAPRRTGPRDKPWQVVLRKKPANAPSAHTLAAATLTDPVEDDEDTGERVSELIAVMALGVMEHHWSTHPPTRRFLDPGASP
jgi:hypothetical protein